jgi:hypothetical protein
MADFSSISLDANLGSQATPTWTSVTGASKEVRWSDLSTQDDVASASWPAMIRPATTQSVDYTYGFTDDDSGTGFIGSAGPPPAFSNNNYHWARWNWDAVGTFASAPIFTAYKTTGHAAISRNDGSLLGGSADTGSSGNERSYLKANLYGRGTIAGAPAAAPTNPPTVTIGSAGSVTPAGATSWCTNYQGLMADTDYITFYATPSPTTADSNECIFALFTGPNMVPSTYTVVISMKYTWT